MAELPFDTLRGMFGDRMQENVPLARYTSSRVGGPADVLVKVDTAEELAETAISLWKMGIPFMVLGGGSNILVHDAGVRGVVLDNQARRIRFDEDVPHPTVWAESGASLGRTARQAAGRGMAGLEWACGIPGTVGGAVIGNAGAHGSDMASTLIMAEILQLEEESQGWGLPPRRIFRRDRLPVEHMGYEYRSSQIKRTNQESRGAGRMKGSRPQTLVLAALMRLKRSTPELTTQKVEELTGQRRKTQPPGASMGSMFKNPPGDYAGRLIDAAGLKGYRSGSAQISDLHANFFINHGGATAADIYALIEIARRAVADKFGVNLELEIELVGDWENG